jgi:carboxypeptidase Taq
MDLQRLKDELAIIEDLRGASSVLAWDQETYLPSGSVEARANQLSTLERIIHERFTSDTVGELIDRVEASDDAGDYSESDAGLIRVVRREYDRATRLSVDHVTRFTETTAKAMPAWANARATDDFGLFLPHLVEIVGLCQEKADAIGHEGDAYDALLDEFEPGMTTIEVEREFQSLRSELVPIVEAIAGKTGPSTAPLHQAFEESKQWDFGLSVISDFGFDLTRGRQDRSAHPFSIHFAPTDVRITTRVDEQFFSPAFFGTLHESGHGMYEQGVALELARTPLAHGTSLGMHESQSRLWENQVGRSKAFWTRYYPDLQTLFPDQLASISLDEFYGAANRVEPSLIRVEADEVTYNLHVMLRFELERALISGDLPVRDLPSAWNEKVEAYLGVRPESDAEGVLQDIHWSMGAFGYFPTYSLGTLMSAQIYDTARKELQDLTGDIERGKFGPLLGWLQDNIYRFGKTYPAQDLLEKVTGSKLDSSHWLAYIREKFGGIYGALS